MKLLLYINIKKKNIMLALYMHIGVYILPKKKKKNVKASLTFI